MKKEIWFEAFDSLVFVQTRSALNEDVTTFFKYCYNPIEVIRVNKKDKTQ